MRGLDRGGRWAAANSSSAINSGGFSHEVLIGVWYHHHRLPFR
jgi:hypothetical protein